MKKRALSFAITLALVASLCAVAPALGAAESTKISDTVIEPTFFICSGSYIWSGTEPVFKAIEEKTGIRFKPITVPLANYTEKLNTTLASGDLPDLMNIRGSAPIDKYGPQGAFVNLSEYVDRGEMPSMISMLEKHDALKYTRSPDGNIYGAPRIYDMDFRLDENYLIRRDVLDKNNLPVPVTFEDLYATLLKLKEIYPGSTPLINRWEANHILEGMTNIRDSFYGFYLNSTIDKVEFGQAKPGYRDALEWLANAYKDGILDPEFATLSDEQWEEKLINGKAFFVFDYADAIDDIAGAAQQVDPDWNFDPWLQPEYNGVRYGTVVLKGYYPSYRAISATSKFADALVKFTEYTYTSVGAEMLEFGIEGDTYTKNADGTITLDPDIKYAGNQNGTRENLGFNNPDMWPIFTALGRDTYFTVGPVMKESTELAKQEKSYGNSYFFYKFDSDDDTARYAELRNQLNTYSLEMSVQVIMGKMTLEQWDTQVIPGFDSLGLQEALTLINDAYAKMNAAE